MNIGRDEKGDKMSRINLLSPDTFSKIAAGEVVERPQSVVKELIENSIDAGSRNITIEIVNGGLDLIKIVDDGRGIENDDLEKAFLPHATSKIKNIDDIFRIGTLGFRGEALASVASVSKVLLKSKSENEEDAMEIYLEGGDVQYKKYSNQNQGTYIEVKELFYNVPARLKFLKSVTKETSSISDTVSRLAISNPEVAFNYINNDKVVLRTYGNGNQRDVIRSVYNRKIYENVSHYDKELDGVRIHGYIGNEEISRGSRFQQSIFINRRLIQSKSITAAVERAYQSFITISKFPFFVVNLEIDPTKIDVNVHPQKAEVKFDDDRFIFGAVFDTVHSALREMYKDNLGFLNNDESKNSENSTIEQYQLGFRNRDNLTKEFNEGATQYKFDIREQDPIVRSITVGQLTDQTNGLENIDKSTQKDEKSYKSSALDELNVQREVSLPIDLKGEIGIPDVNSFNELNAENSEDGHFKVKNSSNYEDKVNSDSEVLYNELVINYKFPKMEIIGQYNKTYILAQLNSTLYLFDQHACHEKINFEKYMKELKEDNIILQPLLVPHLIDLSLDDYNLYIENRNIFENAGFVIEEFGDRTLSIREVPYFLGKVQPSDYFSEIMDNLRNLGKGTKDEVKYMRIATIACKSSIKANDYLTLDEMEKLLDDLRYLDNPFTCPHGRPTMIKFELKEIEKMFRRII